MQFALLAGALGCIVMLGAILRSCTRQLRDDIAWFTISRNAPQQSHVSLNISDNNPSAMYVFEGEAPSLVRVFLSSPWSLGLSRLRSFRVSRIPSCAFDVVIRVDSQTQCFSRINLSDPYTATVEYRQMKIETLGKWRGVIEVQQLSASSVPCHVHLLLMIRPTSPCTTDYQRKQSV